MSISLFQKKEKTALYFTTKTELLDHDYLLQPVPDAYIALENRQKTTRYFVDIFDAQTPHFVLKRRVQQYLEYYEDGAWEDATKHPFPKILLVCMESSTSTFLRHYLDDIREETDVVFMPLTLPEMNSLE